MENGFFSSSVARMLNTPFCRFFLCLYKFMLTRVHITTGSGRMGGRADLVGHSVGLVVWRLSQRSFPCDHAINMCRRSSEDGLEPLSPKEATRLGAS